MRIEDNQVLPPNAVPAPASAVSLSVHSSGSTVFYTIDLTNAYYHVPQHEDSRDLTAFVTHDRHFCQVSCRLASEPAAFQKTMTTILTGICIYGIADSLYVEIIRNTTLFTTKGVSRAGLCVARWSAHHVF